VKTIYRRLARRSLVGLALFLGLLTWGVFWWNEPFVSSAQVTTVPSPAPSHIEWTFRPVGGLLICHPPGAADSTGKVECLTLPPGSVLGIPREVPGEDPDSTRTQT